MTTALSLWADQDRFSPGQSKQELGLTISGDALVGFMKARSATPTLKE